MAKPVDGCENLAVISWHISSSFPPDCTKEHNLLQKTEDKPLFLNVLAEVAHHEQRPVSSSLACVSWQHL